MDNVTLTPHAAFRTLEASETLMRRAIDIAHRIVAALASEASGQRGHSI
jgi:phosphoglycerate dehydrogenase-like enzyme